MNSIVLDGQQGQFGLAILFGLQSKHVYGGSAPGADVARRRARNRAARKSRRINRK